MDMRVPVRKFNTLKRSSAKTKRGDFEMKRDGEQPAASFTQRRKERREQPTAISRGVTETAENSQQPTAGFTQRRKERREQPTAVARTGAKAQTVFHGEAQRIQRTASSLHLANGQKERGC